MLNKFLFLFLGCVALATVACDDDDDNASDGGAGASGESGNGGAGASGESGNGGGAGSEGPTATNTTCATAQSITLADGLTIQGNTTGAGNNADSLEGDDAADWAGPDLFYTFTLDAELPWAKISIETTAKTDSAFPMLFQGTCDNATSRNSGGSVSRVISQDGDIVTHTVTQLEPGTYILIVDTEKPEDQGAFTMTFQLPSAE